MHLKKMVLPETVFLELGREKTETTLQEILLPHYYFKEVSENSFVRLFLFLALFPIEIPI